MRRAYATDGRDSGHQQMVTDTSSLQMSLGHLEGSTRLTTAERRVSKPTNDGLHVEEHEQQMHSSNPLPPPVIKVVSRQPFGTWLYNDSAGWTGAVSCYHHGAPLALCEGSG